MKQIAAAFVKAQKGFAPALKTNTNPHFKSRYVGLDGCIEAVIDALNSNGIALLQPTHEDATGVTVETLFVHESGETLSGGKLHVPAPKQDPQGYGSALTYARRYSLMSACGIAPEDDDGNAASKRGPDVAAILRSISNAQTLDILKSNYEAAMQMLDPAHHQAVKKSASARKAELTRDAT
jgi:ERF superfamily